MKTKTDRMKRSCTQIVSQWYLMVAMLVILSHDYYQGCSYDYTTTSFSKQQQEQNRKTIFPYLRVANAQSTNTHSSRRKRKQKQRDRRDHNIEKNNSSNKTNNTNNRDWREFNYYQILGLQSADYYYSNASKGSFQMPSSNSRTKQRRKITTKDIKKAYRREAQKWHPDKIAHLRKNNNDNGETSIVTVQECNERFSKIAEAYQALNDDEKRSEYDLFLLQSEDDLQRKKQYQRSQQRRQGTRHDQHYQPPPQQQDDSSFDDYDFFSSFHDFKNNFDHHFNPMSVFEDFFFPTMNNMQQNVKSTMSDIFDAFFIVKNDDEDDQEFLFQSSSNQQQQYNHSPDRVSEATQIHYDPNAQSEILRVLHREEYDDIPNGRIYYKVMAQEFFVQQDHYNHDVYVPISDEYFVEDGFEKITTQHQHRERQHQFSEYDNKQQQKNYNDSDSRNSEKKQRQMKTSTSARMEGNEYIKPLKNVYLESNNGQYYAGLTQECEFIILERHTNIDDDYRNEEGEENVIWSSDTYLPGQYQGRGCSFAFYNGRIAIVTGNVDDPMAILWNSPLPSIVPNDGDGHEEDIIEYYVSLDNDGSLAVYRTREFKVKYNNGNYIDNDLITVMKHWFTELTTGNSDIPTTTKAAKTWRSLQRWTKSRLLGKRTSSNGHSNHRDRRRRSNAKYSSHDNIIQTITRDECVYATGPAGCFSAGRYFVQTSKELKRSLDKVIEDFVDIVSEGSAEDLDFLDTATRIVGRGSQYLAKIAFRSMKQNMDMLRKSIVKVKHIITDMTRRLNQLIVENGDADLPSFIRKRGQKLMDFLFETVSDR